MPKTRSIDTVLSAFARGVPARGGSACWTDGTTVYSYQMPIARRVGGVIYLIPRKASPTATTSQHLGAVRRYFSEHVESRSLSEPLVETARAALPLIHGSRTRRFTRRR